MGRLFGYLSAAFFVVACDRPPVAGRAVSGSTRQDVSWTPAHSVSGTVRDLNQQPVPSARVEIISPGFEGRFVVADDRGRYKMPGLTGGIQLRASKAGFFSQTFGLRASVGTIADFTLQPAEQIEIGRVVRAALTTSHPVCVTEAGAVDGAKSKGGRCHQFLIIPRADGTLTVVLTTADGATNLAVDLLAPDGRGAQSPGGSSRENLTTRVGRGLTYHVRVLEIRGRTTSSQDFELHTSLK